MKKKNKLLSRLGGALFAFLLLFAGLSMQAQNLSWTSGYTKMDTLFTVLSDSSNLYVGCKANTQQIPNAKLVITLPPNFDYVSVDTTGLGGSALTYTTVASGSTAAGRTITVTFTSNSGTLRLIDLVRMKFKLRALCNAQNNSAIDLKVTTTGNAVVTGGTNSVPVLTQTPAVLLTAATSTINLPTQASSANFDISMNSTTGNAYSFKVMLRVDNVTRLSDFKVNGTALTTAIVRTRATTAPTTDSVYTLTITSADLQGGKLDAAIQHLTFTGASNGCGSRNIQSTSQYSSATACGTAQNGVKLTMKFPEEQGLPVMTVLNGTNFFTTLGGTTTVSLENAPKDLTTPVFIKLQIKNTGGADAVSTAISGLGIIGSQFGFIDTANIQYKIGNNSPLQTVADAMISVKNRLPSNATYGYLKPQYTTACRLVTINLNDVIAVNDTLTIWIPAYFGNVYSNGNNIVWYYSSTIPPIWGITALPIAKNSCGVSGGGSVPNSAGWLSYTRGTCFRELPTLLSLRANQSVTQKVLTGVYTSSLKTVTVFAEMPDWLDLDGTPESTIKYVRADGSATYNAVAGSGQIYPVANGKRKFSVDFNSIGAITEGYVTFDYKAGTCPGTTANLEDTIHYWLNYQIGAPSATNPSMDTISQVFQPVTMLCKVDGIVLDTFKTIRTTRGLRDSDNNNIPDNGTEALESEIRNDYYLLGDNGYFKWKATMKGMYNYLYLPVTFTGLNLNQLVPDTLAATISINGLSPLSVTCRKIDNFRFYITYDGLLPNNAKIEVILPFTVKGTNDIYYGTQTRCFVSNTEITNPFAPDPLLFHGEDVATQGIGLYSDNRVNNNDVSRPIFTDNVPKVNLNVSYDNYMHHLLVPGAFPNEVRRKYYLAEVKWEVLPEGGYVFGNLKVDYNRTDSPSGYVNTPAFPDIPSPVVNGDAFTYNLRPYFDTVFDGSPGQTLAAGKFMVPSDTRWWIYWYPTIQATRGAPLGISTFRRTATYKNVLTGEETQYTTDLQATYSGMATTLNFNNYTLPVYGPRVRINTVTAGNPNAAAINGMWLYVVGNVNNIKARPLAGGATISGTGYQGRWLQLTTGAVASGAELSYELEFNYLGSSTCDAQEIVVYTVSGFETPGWAPSTGNALNLSDITHVGAKKTAALSFAPASIAGSITTPSTSLVYNTNYNISAIVDGTASEGALVPSIDLVIPAGQQYVPASAKVRYPLKASTTPIAVPTAVENALVAANTDLTVARTVRLQVSTATGFAFPGYLSPNYNADSAKAEFTLTFKPMCQTSLLGVTYMDTLVGSTACGQPAAKSGMVVFGNTMYSNVASTYSFLVGNELKSGNNAFNEFSKTDTLRVTLNKTTGSTATMLTSDSLVLVLPIQFNITGSIKINSPDLSITNVNAVVGSNAIVSGKREIRLNLPVSQYNLAPNKGLNKNVYYDIPVQYTANGQTLAMNPEQELQAIVATNKQFNTACPSMPLDIGSATLKVGIITTDITPNAYQACLKMPVTMTITSDGFTGGWYKDSLRTQTVKPAPAPTYTYTPQVQSDTSFYVSVMLNGTNYGVVPVQVKMYPQVAAGFKADSVCLGLATTFTDTTKIGGLTPSSGTLWNWYADGSATPFSTTKTASTTFTTSGNHTVKLVVESTNGCIDSITRTVYVKPRATVSFTAAPNPVCANTNITFTNTSTITGGTATYSYKYGNGQTGIANIYAYANAGNYVARLIATTNLGCVDSASQNITVNDNTPVNIIQSTPEVCINSTINLTATLNPGTWTSLTPAIATISSLSGAAKGISQGTSKIVYAYTNSNGCISRDTVNLKVNSLPSITVRDTSSCIGTQVNLTNLVTNPSNYGLSFFETPTGGSAVSATATVSGTTAKDYYVEAVNSTTGCTNATRSNIKVTGKAIPTISVNSTGQTKFNGEASDPILFSSNTGATYSWTNSNPSIGIAASGTTATVASATLTNTTGTDAFATITGKAVLNGCESPTTTHTITVKAKIVYSVTPESQTVCKGATTTAVNFNSTATGVTYYWTATSNIGQGATSGSSTSRLPSFTATNTTSSPITSTFKVVPKIGSTKVGDTAVFTITVNPSPTIQTIANQTICNGETKEVYLQGAGTSYTATSSNSTAVSTAFPTNDPTILRLVGTNGTTSPITATITVTPVASGCDGVSKTFTVTVNPTPTVNAIANQIKCNGSSTTLVTFAGNVTGGSYSWSSRNQNIGLTGAASATTIPATALTNNSNSTLEDIITVTPTMGTCTGIPTNFYIRVNPTPTVNTIQDESYCLGETSNAILLNGNVSGSTFTWTFNTPSIKSGVSTATSDVIDPFTTLATGSSTISVTPKYTNYGLTCTGTATTVGTITVKAKPVADFTTTVSGLGQIAFTNASTGTGNTYVWNFGDGTSTVTTTNANHTYTLSGTYTVTLTTTSNGCTSTISKQITVNTVTDLSADFTINQSTQCVSGNSFMLTNNSHLTTPNYNIVTYNWAFGDGTTSTLANPPAKVYAAAGNYTIKLTVTANPGSIQSSISKTITVLDKPVITDGAAPAAVCDGGLLRVNMPAIDWKGNTPVNGTWLLNGTVFDPSTTALTFADSGKVLKYQVNSSCGTSLSTGVVVKVNKLPVADFSTTVAGLSKIQFTNLSTGATSYAWDFGNGVSNTTTSPLYTYPLSGTYNVTLTARSSAGCISVKEKPVTVYNTTDLVSSFTVNNTTQCKNSAFVFSSTSNITTPNYSIATYSWNFGDATALVTTPTATHTYASAGTYTVTLTVTETPGNSTAVSSQTITVLDIPTIANIATPAPVCNGNMVLVNAPTVTWNGNTPVQGVWLLNNVIFDPLTTALTTADNGKMLKYQVTSSCGTATSNQVPITLNALPVADFSTAVTGLAQITFTNHSTGANNYVWNFGDATATSTIASPVHTYTNTGSYSVTLNASSAIGCTSSITKQLYVSTTTDLLAGFTVGQQEQCKNTPFEFTNASRIATPGHSISTYTWDFGDGGNSTIANPTHTYSSAGTYTVKLTVKEAPGNTTAVTTQTVIVLDLPVIGNVTPAAVCSGNLLMVTPPTVNWKNNTPVSGTWMLDGMVFDPLTVPVTTLQHNKPLIYQVNSACGVASSTPVNIVVNANPVADFTTAVSNLGEITFTNASMGTGNTYRWNFGDGSNATTVSPVHQYQQSGTYTVTLTVTSPTGCTSVVSKAVSVSTITDLEASFTVNQTEQCLAGNNFAFQSTSRITTANYSINAYTWNFGDGGTASTANASHIYSAPGTYTVTLTVTETPGNTQSSYSQTVKVIAKPVITDGTAPAAICEGGTLILSMPAIDWRGNTPVSGSWMLGGNVFNPNTPLSASDDGKILQYALTTVCGDTSSTGVAVTVIPNPVMPNLFNQTYCANTDVSAQSLGSQAGVTYRWRQWGDNVGLSAVSGTNTIPTFRTSNTGAVTKTAHFEVTAFNGNCQGNTVYFDINVTPSIVLTSSLNADSICSGTRFEYTSTANMPNVHYTWIRPAIAEINSATAGSGQGAEISEVLTNTSANAVTVEYYITLNYNNCSDNIDTVKVVVKPTAIVKLLNKDTKVCYGAAEVKIPYSNSNSTLPVQYKLTFSNEALMSGFQNMDQYQVLSGGEIVITLPTDAKPQRYIGLLSVKSSDCGTTSDFPFTINVIKPTAITEQPQTEIVLCSSGETLTISVRAEGDSLNYRWFKNGQVITGAESATYTKTNATSADFGMYTVEVSGTCGTVTSNTCKVRTNEVQILPKWNDVLFVSRIDLTGNDMEFTEYQWYKINSNGDLVPIASNATSQYYTNENLSGVYVVEVFYANGRSAMSCPYTFVQAKKKSEFKVYPNPVKTNEKFTVNIENGNDANGALIEIFDATGKRIAFKTAVEANTEFHIPISTGTYIVKVTNAKGEIMTQKVISK